MTARYFVDSNVLVYARDATERGKQKRAELWIETLWLAGAGRLSFQVLIESYAALTRSQMQHMEIAAARTYISNFRRWRPIMVDARLCQQAWKVQDRYDFSWWDCLIVAAAQVTACRYLLTEDLQHAQDLDGVVVINPFEVEPETVQV
jgi:predicted nucleic acid-binding protein